MAIYLDDLNKDIKAWFAFKPAGDPEETDEANLADDQFAVEIRLLTAGERDQVTSKEFYTEFEGDVAKGQLEQKMKIDRLGAREMLTQMAVSGWRGIYEDRKKQKPLPCTQSNKRRLLNRLPGFGAFVSSAHGILLERAEAEREELEKN